MATAKILRDFARPDWQWTHIPSGEARDKRTAGKLKQMGTCAGWPDFVLIPPSGNLHCLELKREGEKLSDEQDKFQDWCMRHGVPHVVAFTIDEVLVAFNVWGCLMRRIDGAR
jgi:hypothetical protein